MEKLHSSLRRPEAEAVCGAEVGASMASILTRDPETGVWRSLHAPAASDIGGQPPQQPRTPLTGHQPPDLEDRAASGALVTVLTISGPSSCRGLTEAH